jgi:hypothetical protein
MARQLTIGDVLSGLFLKPMANCPRWPPDAFAAALSLLIRMDGYSHVVRRWPPKSTLANYVDEMRRIGSAWRRKAARSRPAPSEVEGWWKVAVNFNYLAVSKARNETLLVDSLLQIVAAADEACVGVGIPSDDAFDAFDQAAASLLLSAEKASLCREIDPSRAIVLPKLHTPQSGLSARSLTHHLAFFEAADVAPKWHWMLPSKGWEAATNLLLLPWPRTIFPRQIRSCEHGLRNMSEEDFGFFTFDAAKPDFKIREVKAVLKEAERQVGSVSAIVFPELALSPGKAEALCRATSRLIIGGEGKSAVGRNPGSNTAVVAVPVARGLAASRGVTKHHRWQLDSAQIEQYGLGSQLDPRKKWWEHIEIGPRSVPFWTVNSWFSFCVLICEDLARQEPVTKLVRAVGPNLVVALLMDGPQLAARWPARYATVLADDPGSSVLTLTSLGMTNLSRPPGRPVSRVVAMWKDPTTPAREIELPAGASGLVLSVTRDYREEWTADGRPDDGAAAYLRLGGVHPITLSKP